MNIKYLSLCLTTFAIIGTAFVVEQYARNRPDRNAAAGAAIQPNAVTPAVGPIRNIRFTLFEEGIRPAELRIKTGLVNFALEDKTNNSQGLLVRQVAGSERILLATIAKMPNQWRGKKLLRVLPGTYELQDASRPANKAVLVVEQN